MKESVAVAKEADAKKGVSPTKSDNSIQRLRNEPEMQLGSLRDVIDNIRRDGGTPSVESIATELSSRHTAQRAPVLLALQQTHGNRYVQRVVAGIQAKLAVGQPGDIYEQEADRVADEVMRMPEPEVQRQAEEGEDLQAKPLAEQITLLVQRQTIEEEEEELQAKELSSHASEGTPNLEARINAIRGGGQPLPESTRVFFEPHFGYDFSQVRVQTDAPAAEMAKALNAKAFTFGQNIVFGTGQYALATSEGKRLLAHELTHIVQQNNGSIPAQVIQLHPLDDIRRELHRMPPPTTEEATIEERRAIWERRGRLRRAFESIDPLEAEDIYDRLVNREGDALSMLFHGMLASPTCEEMLEILRNRFPTRIDMEDEILEVPPPPPPRTLPRPFLDLQIACLIDAGGCTLSPAPLRRLNTQCRTQTGYTGVAVVRDLVCIPRDMGIAQSLRRAYPNWLSVLPNCPCTRAQADAAGNFSPDRNPRLSEYHPGADACYRSNSVTSAPGTEHRQQCCYLDGNLITHGSGAGTPDVWTELLRHDRIDRQTFDHFNRDWRSYNRFWVPNRGSGCTP